MGSPLVWCEFVNPGFLASHSRGVPMLKNEVWPWALHSRKLSKLTEPGMAPVYSDIWMVFLINHHEPLDFVLFPEIRRTKWMDIKYLHTKCRYTTYDEKAKDTKTIQQDLCIRSPFLWLWFWQMYCMAQATEHPSCLPTSAYLLCIYSMQVCKEPMKKSASIFIGVRQLFGCGLLWKTFWILAW